MRTSGIRSSPSIFGQLIHAHPHIHALVSEGVFLPDGTFLPLPKLATEPFLKLWEQELIALLLADGKITEEMVVNMRFWKHSGFSIDQHVPQAAHSMHGVPDDRIFVMARGPGVRNAPWGR